jgi:hypothetical protein
MRRLGKDLPGRTCFDNSPLIQDQRPLAQRSDAGEIVRYEQQGDVHFLIEPPEQREYLCLCECIERTRRLIGDQQARSMKNRRRYHDALRLSNADLARIPSQESAIGG